jgi:hypothetical protein
LKGPNQDKPVWPRQQGNIKDNKIPNPKHQITNKSQITIFNDRNTHHSCFASLRKHWSAGDDALGTRLDLFFVWYLEIWSLGFV